MRVGIIGVGHMGHGIALNVLKGGFPLVMLDHPGNQPVHDLTDLGATQGLTPGAVASEVDLIILCVSGSPQVEAVLTATDHTRPGMMLELNLELYRRRHAFEP